MEKLKKSALLHGIIGFLLGLCLIFLIGAGANETTIGRFKVETDFEGETFKVIMSDTQEGSAIMWWATSEGTDLHTMIFKYNEIIPAFH